jgi:hypothetical protein
MTMRSVQDRFWSDGWVRKLNPLDRYLFLYLLTNERSNWCGLYELEIGMMAFESGLDERELEYSMLPRLSPKILYVDGWVYVKNWTRHHMSESGNLSPQQKKGIEDAFSKVPERIRLRIKELDENSIPYVYPIGGVSASSSALSSSLLAELGAKAPRSVIKKTKDKRMDEDNLPDIDLDSRELTDKSLKKKSSAKYPHSKEVFSWFSKSEKSWEMNTTELKHSNLLYARGEKQVKAALKIAEEYRDDKFCPKIFTPSQLEQKWKSLMLFAKNEGIV